MTCFFIITTYADLAQLVEQLNRNQWVGGSSPLVGTIYIKMPKERLFLFYKELIINQYIINFLYIKILLYLLINTINHISPFFILIK